MRILLAANLAVQSILTCCLYVARRRGSIWRIDCRLKKASSRAEGVFVATWSVCSIHTDAGGAALESIH